MSGMRWWSTWTKKLKNWDFWVTKIGGFEGSVGCDRIVKLVLGDAGLEF